MSKQFNNKKSSIFIFVLIFIFALIVALLITKSINTKKIIESKKQLIEAYDPSDTNMALFAYSASTSYIKANDEVVIKLQGVENKLYKSNSLTADRITVKVGDTIVTPTTKTLTNDGTPSNLRSQKFTLTLAGMPSNANGVLKLYVDSGTLTDDAGNLSLQTELSTPVIVDTTAPTAGTLTMKINNSSGVDYTDNSWTNQNVYVSVNNGSDTLSGHASTTFSIDGIAQGGTTATLSTEGIHSLVVTTTDNAGNTASRTYTVKIEKTSPTVVFSQNGNINYSKSQSTNVNVSDASSGVDSISLKYQWTQSTTPPEETSFSSTFTNGATITKSDGTGNDWYLWILAKDNVGNTTIKNSNVFYLDNTLPEITNVNYNGYNSGSWTNLDVNASINGEDEDSGIANIQYSTDNSTWTDVQTNGINILRNTDYNLTYQQTSGWDTTKNGTTLASYWGGYNGGVASPSTGYHANLDTSTFGYNVARYINKNSEVGYTNRWMGMSQSLSAGTIQAGETYTISMEIYADTAGMKVFGGLYHALGTATTNGFNSGQYNFLSTSSELNTWTEKTWTFTANSNLNETVASSWYIYGYGGAEGTVYVKNVKLEKGHVSTNWSKSPVDTTGNLHFTTEMNSSLYYRAIDKAGNISNINSGTKVQIDKTAPTINQVQAGTMMYTDPTFNQPTYDNGINHISAYNNSGGGTVTVTRGAMTTPTGSGFGLTVQTTGTASPGWGGFYFATPTSANKTFVTRIVAKIPVGYTINWASNAYGSESTTEWLTSQAGTGDWAEYIFKVSCSSTGTFSSTNFFYLTGGTTPTVSSPLTWYVAYATVYDTTKWGQSNTVTFKATATGSGIVGYGINQSSTTQPTYTTISETSTIATQIENITTTGTYYLWTIDKAGNSSNQLFTVAYVDTTKPTATITANGGASTIASGSTSTTVSTTLTAADTGGSGLASSQYAWSTSNTAEPTSWANFIATGQTVTYTATTGGNYYLWTKVFDNAGCRAETIKTSNAFSVNYAVDYDANGGTGAPSSQTKTHDTALTLSTTVPTMTGWTFAGWGTAPNDTSVDYASGASYTANASIKLYAIWKKDVTVTGTFDKNGGTADTSASGTTTIYNGATSVTVSITTPAYTTNTSWTCLGYNTSSTATTASKTNGVSISITATVASGSNTATIATGYYHIWKKDVTVTGTFDKNGGTADTSSSGTTTIYNGATSGTVTITVPDYTTRSGFTCVGYNINSSATTATITSGTSISITATVASGSNTATIATGYYHIWFGITTQPINKAVNNGTTAVFSVVSTNATSYQWQYRTSSTGTWVNVTTAEGTGGTTAIFTTVTTTTAMNGYQYKCNVTNTGVTTTTLTTNIANLSVYGTPTTPIITATNSSGTVTTGNWSTSNLTITISGGTLSGAGAIEYQYSYDNSTWTNYTGTIVYSTETSGQTIYARSYNTSSTTLISGNTTYIIKIDKTAPTITRLFKK